MRTFLLVFLCCFTYHLMAQKIVISGQEGNRMLTWEDFAGTPDNSSSYFAYTAYSTKFKFDGVSFEGDKAILKGFLMTLEFEPKKSWVKKGKETTDLLKHEQGHFDVGLLYMQEVMEKIVSYSFTRSGYKEEFEKLMKDLHKKYVDMGTKYDEETAHSIKKDEQEKWNVFFGEKVRR